MKLTQKELIRLKKETHLLEHDFYHKEILRWWAYKSHTSVRVDEFDITYFGGKLTKWGKEFDIMNEHIKKEIEKMWFREKFPEFFEEELKR
jgi:hypothetical protein